MDLRKLKTLIDLVSESNVSELEITEAEGKVRIVKGAPPAPAQVVYAPVAPPVAAPGPAAPAASAAPAAEAAAPAPAEEPAGFVLKSPMVVPSTVHPAPAPNPSSRWASRSRKATRCASSRR